MDTKTKEEWKVEADTLKIVLNSSFGKFGSRYSILYSPKLLLQTTITGQLALLKLIEMLHLRGVETVSANTDGIVVRTKDKDTFNEVCEEWEKLTGFNLEYNNYDMIFNESVNSYFAITEEGKVKGKGAYAGSSLSKNPAFIICQEAIMTKAKDGTPIVETIRNCKDLSKFICLRKVSGGGTWRGEDVGKTVRWYIAKDGENITYIKNGNNVPLSDGAYVCNKYPKSFPTNIDYDWYIKRAKATWNAVKEL